MSEFINPYFWVLISLVICLLVGGAASFLSLVLGPKKPNLAKSQAYECGLPTKSQNNQKLSVKFYLTAILFILFDIETIFLYLWAVAFDLLQWFGVMEIGLFMCILITGYIYVIKRQALSWET